MAMSQSDLAGNFTRLISKDASTWGPIKWAELHFRASYPGLRLEVESIWLDMYIDSLPCEICRQHFRELRRKFPEDLSSRRSYYEWTVKIHNKVNVSQGKPEHEPQFRPNFDFFYNAVDL